MDDVSRFDFITVDNWPLVEINLQRTPDSMTDIDNFQARFCALLSLAINGSERIPKGKLFLMMKIDGLIDASLEQKFRAASFIKEVAPYVIDGIGATALVIENEMARLIFEFIISIQPLKSKHKVFESMDDARAWLVEEKSNT